MKQKKKKHKKPGPHTRAPVNSTVRIASPVEDRHDEESNEQPKQHAADKDPHEGARPMSAYVFGVGLAIGAILLGFAGLIYSQHTYASYIWALILGITGYAVFGIGLVGGYWANIVKPAKATVKIDRPRLAIEKIFMQTFEAGKPEVIRMVTKNRGSVTAKKVRVFNTIAHLPSDFGGPLVHAAEQPDSYGDVEAGNDMIFEFHHAKWANSEADIAAINAGEVLVFSYGKIEYENEDGTIYPLDYCFMYAPSTPERYLAVCPEKYLPITDAAKTPRSVIDRPYVWIVGVTNDIRVGEAAKFRIAFRNSGNSPALKLRVASKGYAGPALPEPLSYPDLVGSPFLLARDDVVFHDVTAENVMTQDTAARIKNHEWFIYIWGKGEYQDSRGTQYKFTYCTVFEPKTGAFKMCPKYNDAG